MNNVTLIGNLVDTPELRFTTNGRAVANMRVAIDRVGQEGAVFVGVTAWERQAETCAENLEKGARVGVSGRLDSRSWETQDGSKRSEVFVTATQVDFLGGAKSPTGQQ